MGKVGALGDRAVRGTSVTAAVQPYSVRSDQSINGLAMQLKHGSDIDHINVDATAMLFGMISLNQCAHTYPHNMNLSLFEHLRGKQNVATHD